MVTKLHSFSNPSLFSFDDTELAVMNSFVSLKQQDTQGRFDPHGDYTEGSTIIFPELVGDSITEFFSIFDCSVLNNGEIGYQVSCIALSGVYSYYYWDDSLVTWVLATSDTDPLQFSTILEIDTHLDTLTKNANDMRLKIKARLTSSTDRKSSPVLFYTAVSYEAHYDYIEDFKLTLKDHLETAEIRYKGSVVLPEASVTVDLTEFTDSVAILSVESVRNVTTGVAVVGTFNTDTKIFTFTTQQAASSCIIFNFLGRPEVTIGSNVDYEIEPINAITIEVSEDYKRSDSNEGLQIDCSVGRLLGRIRDLPTQHDMVTFIRSISNLAHFCDAVSSTLTRFFEENPVCYSLASGQEIIVLDRTAWRNTSDPEDQISSRTGVFVFVVNVPREEYKELPLISEIEFVSGTNTETTNRMSLDDEGGVTSEEIYPH